MLAKLVLLGAPGVGKGTFASLLSERWRLPHISTGDMIREEIKKKSPLGMKVKAIADSGQLVPDEIVISIAKEKLSKSESYILDGFPRTKIQAKALDEFSPPHVCLNIFLKNEILVQRLAGRRVCSNCNATYNIAVIQEKGYEMGSLAPSQPNICDKCKSMNMLRQRPDDSEDIIKERLGIYKTETQPLEDFYRAQGKLLEFEPRRGKEDAAVLEKLILDALVEVHKKK
eukprot:Trichotokara_eunicae@DN3526_c0_g1_i1.p1